MSDASKDDETKPTNAPPGEPYPLPDGWWWGDDDVADSHRASVWVDDDGDMSFGGEYFAPAAVILAVLHRAGLLSAENQCHTRAATDETAAQRAQSATAYVQSGTGCK